VPSAAREILGSSLAAARLLGKRNRRAARRAAQPDDPAFALNPTAPTIRGRSTRQAQSHGEGVAAASRRPSRGRPAELAKQLLARERTCTPASINSCAGRLTAQRARIHGDYHLGNVLWTGKDFAAVDFGQHPDKPLAERRRKRSGLRDIASMLRSFDIAANMALRDPATVRESERGAAEPWAKLWATWVPAEFLSAYLEAAKGSPFLPQTRQS